MPRRLRPSILALSLLFAQFAYSDSALTILNPAASSISVSQNFAIIPGISSSSVLSLDYYDFGTYALDNSPPADSSSSLSLFPQIERYYKQDSGTCWLFTDYRLFQAALRKANVLEKDEFVSLNDFAARVLQEKLEEMDIEFIAKQMPFRALDPLNGGIAGSGVNFLLASLKKNPALRVIKIKSSDDPQKNSPLPPPRLSYSPFIQEYENLASCLEHDLKHTRKESAESTPRLSEEEALKKFYLPLAESHKKILGDFAENEIQAKIPSNLPTHSARTLNMNDNPVMERLVVKRWHVGGLLGRYIGNHPGLLKLYRENKTTFGDAFYNLRNNLDAAWTEVRANTSTAIKEFLDEALAQNRLVGIAYDPRAITAAEMRNGMGANPNFAYGPSWQNDSGMHASVIFGRLVDQNGKSWYRVSDSNVDREDIRAVGANRPPRNRLIPEANLYLIQLLTEVIGRDEIGTEDKIIGRRKTQMMRNNGALGIQPLPIQINL